MIEIQEDIREELKAAKEDLGNILYKIRHIRNLKSHMERTREEKMIEGTYDPLTLANLGGVITGLKLSLSILDGFPPREKVKQ